MVILNLFISRARNEAPPVAIPCMSRHYIVLDLRRRKLCLRRRYQSEAVIGVSLSGINENDDAPRYVSGRATRVMTSANARNIGDACYTAYRVAGHTRAPAMFRGGTIS